MRILWSLIAAAVGFLIIRYSISLADAFGHVEWAERHLGGGLAGTYTLYRLIGLAILIFSLLYMFGGLGFILSPLAHFFGG